MNLMVVGVWFVLLLTFNRQSSLFYYSLSIKNGGFPIGCYNQGGGQWYFDP